MIVAVRNVSGSELLQEAESAFAGVVRDPLRYAPTAPDLLRRARRSGEPEVIVVALRAQAWARHAALDNLGATRLLGEAIRLAASHDLRERLGEVLTTRAVALHELGRHTSAARDLARAVPLVTGARRPEVAFQQAVLEHNAGRIRAAAELYRQVLTDPACPAETWVKAANNAALVATLLGRPRSALPWLRRAAELAEPMGPLLVALTRNNLAVTTFNAGGVVEGLRLFEEAGALYAPAGLPLGEHYLDYSDALVDLRLLDEALRIARAAAAEFEQERAPLMAAEARLRSARLAHAVGQLDAAWDDVRVARDQLRRQRRPAWVARAILAEAEILMARGADPDEVLPSLRRAARTLERSGLPAAAVEAHLMAGRAAAAAHRPAPAREHLMAASRLAAGRGLLVRLRGRLARALVAELDDAPSVVLDECRRGLADLSRHRAALPSVELRALAAGHGTELGELGLRTVLAGPPGGRAGARALAWMERTRAAALLTVEPPVPELDDDVALLRAVDSELRLARREQGREPAELQTRRAALEQRIRRASWIQGLPRSEAPGPSGPSGPSGPGGPNGPSGPVDPRARRGASDPGRVRELLAARSGAARLVELAVVGGDLHAVVTSATTRCELVRLGPLAPVALDAESALFALRRGLRGGRFAAPAQEDARACLARLRRALVEPLAVPDDAELVVVPAGPLHRVPWSSLHPGPLTLAPSAELWARTATAVGAGATQGLERVVLVAGPGLEGATTEVVDLNRVYPEAAVLLPPSSTVEATVRLVTGAELAHLACHGRLRTDNPLFSALELSDGALTVHELLARGVAPRRMVLAACDSGADGVYQGNEVLGFVSALMARGTTAVLASVLPLPDGASATIMRRVHERLRAGDTMGVALHRARADVPEETTDPVDPWTFSAWCGLVAYGAG